MKKIIIGAAVAATLATGALAAQKTFNQLQDSDLQYIDYSGTCVVSRPHIKASMREYFVKNKIAKQVHPPVGSIYRINSVDDSGTEYIYIFFSNLNICKEYIKL